MEGGIEHAASSEQWLRHTLEEILSQIRVLLDVDGCAFQTIDFERRHITPAASWFETPDLRTAMQAVFDRADGPERGGALAAAPFRPIAFGRPHIAPAASWFEPPDLRTAMQPVFDRPYDPERGGVTEAAVERGETVLITDMERWKGAGALRARLRAQLDEE